MLRKYNMFGRIFTDSFFTGYILTRNILTRIARWGFVVLALLVSVNSFAAVWSITYPRSEVENDARYVYPLALLELALDKTGVRYELKASESVIRQARAVKRLEENLEINVLWSMTDAQREEQLLPIRIPITRGLIGWRMIVAHKNSVFLRARISDKNSLLKYSPVQGISWPDTKILQANGFNVVTARDYIQSTQLLNNQLADFFPRSVIEGYQELDNQYSSNFRPKEGILLHYPAAQYFFTNKQNLTLSRLIETGLQKAIEDGSYQALFNKHFGETLQKLDVENAIFFELSNPLLPILTPLDKQEFWYQPNRVFGNHNQTQ